MEKNNSYPDKFEKKEMSEKEKRIRSITAMYYSRPEIQKAMYEFSKNREISPRFYEGFGKRPDILQYPSDIFSLSQKGATSFHCSEELWSDPLGIVTGMTQKQASELRIGWDLIIDIDCKWLDYSKLAAKAVVDALAKDGVKNVGVKFSGSKGFHIIVPWNSFPKELSGFQTKDLFPDLPRKLITYLRSKSEKLLKESLPDEFYQQFKDVDIKRGIKCKRCSEIASESYQTILVCPGCDRKEERRSKISLSDKIFKCPDCRKNLEIIDSRVIYLCENCNITSKEKNENFTSTIEVDLFDLLGLDIILVSPRHLFRMPLSLHEKTALCSLVIEPSEILKFEITDASPLKVKVKNFLPQSSPNEAKEFVIKALDWIKQNEKEEPYSNLIDKKVKGDFEPVKVAGLTDDKFPPSIIEILKGVRDGRKRAIFVLINFFRALDFESSDIEKRLYEWNEKNEVPLKTGYIKSQLQWSFRNKIVLPPNYDKDYYKGIGINPTQDELNLRNPVSYVLAKFDNQNKIQVQKQEKSKRKKVKKDKNDP